jgi:hypothetical protein
MSSFRDAVSVWRVRNNKQSYGRFCIIRNCLHVSQTPIPARIMPPILMPETAPGDNPPLDPAEEEEEEEEGLLAWLVAAAVG